MAGERLTQAQQDKLLAWIVDGFGDGVIKARMKSEEGIELTTSRLGYWRTKAKKEGARVGEEYRQRVHERSFARRLSRIDVLIGHAESLLSSDIAVENWSDLKKQTDAILKTLQHIATELREWQTGNVYNVFINTMTPVWDEIAMWAVRYIPENEQGVAVADLRRISEKYSEQLKALPDPKTIAVRARQK